MSTTQSYIQSFTFAKSEGWFLSDPTRISASNGVVSLRLQQPAADLPGRGWTYPTSGSDYVRTATFGPTAMTSWGFVQIVGDTPTEDSTKDDTTFALRVYDATTTSSIYWNGLAWVAAGANDWNTLADFNTNLPSVTSTEIAIEIRLRTTNPELAPRLNRVLLKWTGRILDPFRTWVYDAVLGSLGAAIRPETDVNVESDGTTSFSFSSSDLGDSGWNLVDVIGAYDLTADPGLLTNLLSSYSAGVVNLSSSVASGDPIRLVCTYAPQIAITTDPDFSEQALAPAILITRVAVETNTRRAYGASGPGIIDESAAVPAGTVFPNPVPLLNIEFGLATFAPLSLDLVKLNTAVTDWMAAHPTLSSSLLDASVRLEPGLPLDWNTSTNTLGEPRMGSASFRLRDVPWYGSARRGSADGSGSARVGPVNAGDPGSDGIGYGVQTVKVAWSSSTGSASDDQEID